MAPRHPVVSPRRTGDFFYSAGTGTGTINIPSPARLGFVSLTAGASAATMTVGGGDTITVPANTTFANEFNNTTLNLDVVIGGVPAAYYVDWYTP